MVAQPSLQIKPTVALAKDQNTGSAQADAMLANLKNSVPVVVESRVFRSNVPSCVYVFKAGKRACFMGGKYTTNIAHEIEELDEEIRQGHPHITSKPEEKVMQNDPMEVLRAKFREELLAEQAAAAKINTNIGASEQGKLNVATSKDLAQVSAGSTSGAVAPAGAVK